jgi:hypothetical protein
VAGDEEAVFAGMLGVPLPEILYPRDYGLEIPVHVLVVDGLLIKMRRRIRRRKRYGRIGRDGCRSGGQEKTHEGKREAGYGKAKAKEHEKSGDGSWNPISALNRNPRAQRHKPFYSQIRPRVQPAARI